MMDRGELTTAEGAIQNGIFAQDWALDALGNWKNFREGADGDSTWDLNQQRAANKLNEITDISETTGPSWVTPVYDKAGSMRRSPSRPIRPWRSRRRTTLGTG